MIPQVILNGRQLTKVDKQMNMEPIPIAQTSLSALLSKTFLCYGAAMALFHISSSASAESMMNNTVWVRLQSVQGL